MHWVRATGEDDTCARVIHSKMQPLTLFSHVERDDGELLRLLPGTKAVSMFAKPVVASGFVRREVITALVQLVTPMHNVANGGM
ncbi:hypothetical protein Bphy_7165 (plasmid) [Paraburkholderia phymatum STM815]|uniref:Uncharacterized protein n=1 Tax=Paraburkholderia phymatum (strain DSM 17167 / CIP 108236 / LMG 21445 / STM815) TaxID=391038 RepID=B2JUJ5_PARP8|nr:hypothetical protein Bphy_7165 [Paraburkholderia phymatum STM815]